LFSRKFGVPYPYPRYAQVFVADFIFGGMENTSATSLTDSVLLDERAAIDYDVDSLVAHELAHQWFGDLVTCRDWGEGWLNEGFATYAEYLWREHHEGRDAADLELEDWADSYFGEDAGRYRRTIATKLYDEPIDIFDHHLYDKGGRVLHMLRDWLGDDAFERTLAYYLRKHAGGLVESRDLARAVEDATGKVADLAPGIPSSACVRRGMPRPSCAPSRSIRPSASKAGRRCSGCRRGCGFASAIAMSTCRSRSWRQSTRSTSASTPSRAK
jgi:aminopeptidase N